MDDPMLDRINGRALAVAAAVLLLTATFFTFRGGGETRTVTAHFPRAVSVYQGTDVRVLGVNVGKVTAVTPEGNSVRVEMEYDAKYQLPSDAKAVIVTPTLVADRFVQLTPAYDGSGQVMAEGADIPLPETAVPVELDRIYASLRDLSEALGPNGVNKDGTLDHLLQASARSLKGQGELGNEMLRNLSAATETFGNGSEDLFASVTELAEFTQVLGQNDRLVRAFMRDLAGMSSSLVSERVELERALNSVARAVGTVKTFVHDNRQALVTDLEKLTRVLKTINSERESLDTALQVAPLALGNLAVAFNNETGTIGSRIGVNGTFGDADGLLCSLVQQSDLPKASKELACTLFEQLLEPVEGQAGKARAGGQPKVDPSRVDPSQTDPASRKVPQQYATNDNASFGSLVGGGS
jgi:phospholipid/cholesterol/gamma-HCH transport system substrate-binding protein